MATSESDDVPREPSAFRPTNHFGQRFREPKRHLDGEIVATVIREGTVTHRQADKYHLDADVEGVTFRLAVNPVTNEVITGHPLELDEQRACESGRWSDQDVSEMREFIDSHPY